MTDAFIYALLDNGEPRYVGVTKDLTHRINAHWTHRRSDNWNPHLHTWLRSLDECPEYRVVAQVAHADRHTWEKYYTERLREKFSLFNIRAGNTAPPEVMARFQSAGKSPEARAKQAATRRGKHFTMRPRAYIIEPGQQYGRWTVLEETRLLRAGHPGGQRAALCVCTCGTRRIVSLRNLVRGNSRSCGCYCAERMAQLNRSLNPTRHVNRRTDAPTPVGV